jgi:hypothetical protein
MSLFLRLVTAVKRPVADPYPSLPELRAAQGRTLRRP